MNEIQKVMANVTEREAKLQGRLAKLNKRRERLRILSLRIAQERAGVEGQACATQQELYDLQRFKLTVKVFL